MADLSANDRAQQILKSLIEVYIRDGQPVGSNKLMKEKAVALSSASIRNIMSDLEDLGFLHSPHTSAGRVPTIAGYRFFVDTLLCQTDLTATQIEKIESELREGSDPQALLATTSNMLSNLTQLAGVVTLPKIDELQLCNVEFLSLSDNRILVILVLSDGEIQNRVIYTHRKFSSSELQRAANYITDEFSGKTLQEVRSTVVDAMRDHQKDIISLLDVAFETEQDPDYVLTGESNLFDIAEKAGVERLRSLFEAFTSKRDILHLMEQCIQTEDIKIFIGDESGYDGLGDCSVVTAPYSVDGKIVGALGVIGPTRMAYDRIIPFVNVTAKLLGAALGDQDKNKLGGQ